MQGYTNGRCMAGVQAMGAHSMCAAIAPGARRQRGVNGGQEGRGRRIAGSPETQSQAAGSSLRLAQAWYFGSSSMPI